MNNDIKLIKSELINKAIYFLEKMGFFHPFGLELTTENKLILHGVEESDLTDLPENEIIIDRVTKKLLESIESSKSKTIGLAINTTYTKAGFKDVNCIEIRILDNSTEELQTYIRYFLKDNNVEIFDETITPWDGLINE